MDGGHHHRRQVGVDQAAPIPGDAEAASEQGLGRRGAEADEHARVHGLQFGRQPRPARLDLFCVGLLVDSALALRRPLEVLDGVGDVHLGPIDPRRFQRLVEHPPRGSDEGAALLVLLVARLLADEHDLGVT